MKHINYQTIIRQPFNIRRVIYSWLFIANCLFYKEKICLFVFCFWIGGLPASYSFSQGTWTQKANFGGAARWGAVGFSIGTKGYIGTGSNNLARNNDFWEWDQATNVWTQKANFGGVGRDMAIGFSIGTKGYIGTGRIWANSKNDFWEWDQLANTWTQKTNFSGTARWGVVGFSIGTKGYIGTGNDGAYKKDFWEWDQASNTWTQKANFTGAARDRAVGFSIGVKGYIGTGTVWPTLYNDFWEWDQTTNIWIQKANFTGAARCEATGFSAGNYGYIGIGQTGPGATNCVSDFWRYDPAANIWVQMANFGGGVREFAVGFSIGCNGYVGTGFLNTTPSTVKNDLWEYTPNSNPCNTLNLITTQTNPHCHDQCTGMATITPVSGSSPYTYTWSNNKTTQVISGLCAGTYSVLVTDATSGTAMATVTITQPTLLTATAAVTNSVCGSNNGSATVTAGGGTPGYTYSWNNGQTLQIVTGLAAGNYTVTITDANGCTATQTITVVSTGSTTATSQFASLCSGFTYTLPGGTVVSTSGTYNDTLTSVAGCDSIITTTLTVNPSPTATAFSSVTITQGQSVTLIASGGGTYTWNNGENDSSIVVSPVATTVYCITVTDINKCTDTACVTITIEPIDCFSAGELYLPNAFSPNNDGENDKLQIYYGNIKCIHSFNLVIYNRWGEKIFETTDTNFKWDGTSKGKIMNTAVMVYYLQATTVDGKDIIRKGNIALIK